jgi:hypothetical protein
VGQDAEALKSDIAERRENMTETIDAIGDRVVPGRIVERRRAAMRGWATGMRERVMGPVRGTKGHVGAIPGRVGDGMSQMTDTITDAPAHVQEATAGSPLIAGAVAFGLGALIAALLPETEPERKAVQAVQPQVEAVTEAVKDAGQHAIETGKDSTQSAAQDLKESASDHAHQATDEAKGAAQQVKDTASSG